MREGARERETERERDPFDVPATTHHKVNSKGLLKMHDMHTTRK